MDENKQYDKLKTKEVRILDRTSFVFIIQNLEFKIQN